MEDREGEGITLQDWVNADMAAESGGVRGCGRALGGLEGEGGVGWMG